MRQKPKVGQTVYLYEANRRGRAGQDLEPGVVTTVGRKYFTVEGKTRPSMEIECEIGTWRQRNTGFGTGYDWLVYETEQKFEDDKTKDQLCQRLAHSVTWTMISLQRLQEIAVLVDLGYAEQQKLNNES